MGNPQKSQEGHVAGVYSPELNFSIGGASSTAPSVSDADMPWSVARKRVREIGVKPVQDLLAAEVALT